MTTLARRIKNRGHDVVAIGTADLELFVRAAGLPFAVYCEEEFPAGIGREVFEERSRLNGREALEASRTFMYQTLSTTIFPGGLRFLLLIGRTRQPRKRLPEIKRVFVPT